MHLNDLPSRFYPVNQSAHISFFINYITTRQATAAILLRIQLVLLSFVKRAGHSQIYMLINIYRAPFFHLHVSAFRANTAYREQYMAFGSIYGFVFGPLIPGFFLAWHTFVRIVVLRRNGFAIL